MNRRSRRIAHVTASACLLLGVAAPAAQSYVITDIVDFDLTTTTSTYGPGTGTQFHVASGTDGVVSYRWLDTTTVATVISGNSCSDLSNDGNHTYNAGVTDYRELFSGFAGQCFYLRGRTGSGMGSMSNKDGRVQR